MNGSARASDLNEAAQPDTSWPRAHVHGEPSASSALASVRAAQVGARELEAERVFGAHQLVERSVEVTRAEQLGHRHAAQLGGALGGCPLHRAQKSVGGFGPAPAEPERGAAPPLEPARALGLAMRQLQRSLKQIGGTAERERLLCSLGGQHRVVSGARGILPIAPVPEQRLCIARHAGAVGARLERLRQRTVHGMSTLGVEALIVRLSDTIVIRLNLVTGLRAMVSSNSCSRLGCVKLESARNSALN
jgi:hypothetical protein